MADRLEIAFGVTARFGKIKMRPKFDQVNRLNLEVNVCYYAMEWRGQNTINAIIGPELQIWKFQIFYW